MYFKKDDGKKKFQARRYFYALSYCFMLSVVLGWNNLLVYAQTDSSSIDTYMKAGWGYFEKKEFAQAVDYYTKVIKFNPRYALAYRNRALTYHSQRQYKLAIADYLQAIKLGIKNDVVIYYYLGTAHDALGKTEEAKKYYKQLLQYASSEQKFYIAYAKARLAGKPGFCPLSGKDTKVFSE